jgi:hypothetical protein
MCTGPPAPIFLGIIFSNSSQIQLDMIMLQILKGLMHIREDLRRGSHVDFIGGGILGRPK